MASRTWWYQVSTIRRYRDTSAGAAGCTTCRPDDRSTNAAEKRPAEFNPLTQMSHPGEPSRVAAALNCLRSGNHFFEFDDGERVVHVAINDATKADEIAAHVGHLHDLRKLIFVRTDLTDEGLRHLGGLVDLRELWLCGLRITATG